MAKLYIVLTGAFHGKHHQFILEFDLAEIQIAFNPYRNARNPEIAAMILLPIFLEFALFFRNSA